MIHMTVGQQYFQRIGIVVGGQNFIDCPLQTSKSTSCINQNILFRSLNQIHQLCSKGVNSGNVFIYCFCWKF